MVGTDDKTHTSEWTRSNGAYKIETFLLKGKFENLTSLQPQQYKISLVCNFPKATIDVSYFNLERYTHLEWKCHK